MTQLSAADGQPRKIPLARYSPWIVFALGIAAIWIPERPPMADLPQHAGQIALLRDLIIGDSPWKSEVWVNLFTPYLLGYALTLPLTFVMPVAAAMKCLLTAAYAAFGLLGMAIRRELAVSPRLDAYYFVSFLGFAYSWGLYTFLVAAPVGLAFIWLSIRYAGDAGVRRGVALGLLGVALLFSHGLVFLYATAIGAVIVWMRNPRLSQMAVRALPFIPSVVLAALIFVISREQDVAQAFPLNDHILMGGVLTRIQQFFTDAFGLPARLPFICFLILAAAPLLGGLRLNAERRECLVPVAVTVGALAFAPDFIWSTAFVYSRLSLFLPPAYAWLFREPSMSVAESGWRTEAAGLAAGLLALMPHVSQAVRFSAEMRDFDQVMAKAVPGQRALGLILDLRSASGPDPAVYESFPSWYQADKHGFVDVSFSDLHEEVVRFKTDPPVQTDRAFPYHAARFDWRADDAGRYRYFFVRSAGPVPTSLFRGAPCAPKLIAASGEWRLFERRACPREQTGKGP